jgi:hypothetical protein
MAPSEHSWVHLACHSDFPDRNITYWPVLCCEQTTHPCQARANPNHWGRACEINAGKRAARTTETVLSDNETCSGSTAYDIKTADLCTFSHWFLVLRGDRIKHQHGRERAIDQPLGSSLSGTIHRAHSGLDGLSKVPSWGGVRERHGDVKGLQYSL